MGLFENPQTVSKLTSFGVAGGVVILKWLVLMLRMRPGEIPRPLGGDVVGAKESSKPRYFWARMGPRGAGP